MLAGIYITDDYVDVVVGRDVGPSVAPDSAPFVLEQVDHQRIYFDEISLPSAKKSITATFLMVAAWIKSVIGGAPLNYVGVGSYGPFVTINDRIPVQERVGRGYGRIGNGLHTRLRGVGLYEQLLAAFERAGFQSLPSISIQTDVNVAALGELYNRHLATGQWDKDGREQVIAFVKVSHGVGGGVIYGQELWAGRLHPEMGQIRVPRWPGRNESEAADEYSLDGVCRFHSDCVEGFSNVESFKHRWGIDYDDLVRKAGTEGLMSHPAWQREAYYIAQICVTLVCLFSPSRIVLGGRVMAVGGMIDLVRDEFAKLTAGRGAGMYPDYQDVHLDNFIDKNSDGRHGGRPGVMGALGLAALLAKVGPSPKRKAASVGGNILLFPTLLPTNR